MCLNLERLPGKNDQNNDMLIVRHNGDAHLQTVLSMPQTGSEFWFSSCPNGREQACYPSRRLHCRTLAARQRSFVFSPMYTLVRGCNRSLMLLCRSNRRGAELPSLTSERPLIGGVSDAGLRPDFWL